ncbi:integrase-like protein [Lentzea atacamensis]|uniref:Integrase-like protein n=1 Tax=Lentzea atacamensis TaxID=531938 RepID=A0A316HY78_9PSEU|nr:N-terminal phage integrase SAM-like domain-containing protein [Lentzea atacamensis]PWK83224.1 integrase-like protein [Lentzea atacamensis]
MAWTEQIGKQSWRVRYHTGDGHTASICGFATKLAAENGANDIESDQRRNTWLDPARGKTILAEWATIWFAALDLDPRTIDNYRSMLRCHILLRWGSTPVNAITALGVNKWIADLHALGYANSTIAGIVKLLSMILTDAADEGLIPRQPRPPTQTPRTTQPPHPTRTRLGHTRGSPPHRRPSCSARWRHRQAADHHRRLDRVPLG